MERRKFIKYAGAGAAAAGLFKLPRSYTEELRGIDELEYHRVTGIRFTTVKLNYPRQVGKNSQLDIHGFGPTSGIHVLFTDKGASGWGLNRASEKVLGEKFEIIKGKSISEFFDPTSGLYPTDIEGFDFSVFDLAGKILEKPVYRLLGKEDLLPFPATVA